MNKLIFTARKIALLSFSVGTLILISHLFLIRSFLTIKIGVGYTLGAFIINSIVLLALIIKTFATSYKRMELIKTCGLVLFNIPITILYIFIVIYYPYY
jgi:hypothetical protein